MNRNRNSRYISLFIAASMAFTSTGIPANAKDKNTETLSMLSRVIESNNNGLLRYAYVDSDGNKQKLSTPSTDNLRQASNIPSKYDLRDKNLSTSIKDQGVTGACWAFAAIKASESNSMLKSITNPGNTDFSESHLTWYSYNSIKDRSNAMYGDGITPVSAPANIPHIFPMFENQSSSRTTAYDIGGNALTAIATLAQWSGIETEDNAPFTAGNYNEEYSMADNMASKDISMRYNSVAHLQNSECYDNSTRAQIKKALMEHGAIDISMFYDECGFETNSLSGKSFYQVKYSGEMAQRMANHCVTIVGWDDNYSRNNFRNRPSGNGAWLIANSYGPKYNDNGYFWLSYDEPSICDIFTFDVEPVSNYDNNYQYDGIGYGDTVYIKNKSIQGANVFTADKDSAQSLKAVSFYTLTDKQAYTIKIYKNVSGKSPTKGTLVKECTTNGTAKLSGYHTIPLSSSCKLDAGEKFSVVITYKYNSSNGSQAYLPIEGQDIPASSVKYSYSSKKGQSYYYLNKKWHDASSNGLNNICIKAFTTDLDKPSVTPSATPVPAETATPAPSATPVITESMEPVTTNTPGATESIEPVTTNTPGATGSMEPVTTDMPGATASAIPGSNGNTSIPAVTGAPADTDTTPSTTGTPAASAVPVPSGSLIFDTARIKISKNTVTLGKNEDYKLGVSINSRSSNLSLDNIKYTSNNNKVAVVDSSGMVTAKSVGTAIITAFMDRAEPARIEVNVKKAPSMIKLTTPANKKVKKGNTFKITAKVPDGSASYHFKYSSSNNKIAKVNKKGNVKALKKGKTVITVKTYNNKKAAIKLTVK
ncbi:MAG: Ig-like domain-containing protein [Lachnospiraceae bacterium]